MMWAALTCISIIYNRIELMCMWWGGEKCVCMYACVHTCVHVVSARTMVSIYVLLLALQFEVVNCSVVVITAYR